MSIYYISDVGVLLLNTLMTIGEDNQDRHVDSGWENVTKMIIEHFIRRNQHTEVIVMGFYWKTGNVVWNSRE